MSGSPVKKFLSYRQNTEVPKEGQMIPKGYSNSCPKQTVKPIAKI